MKGFKLIFLLVAPMIGLSSCASQNDDIPVIGGDQNGGDNGETSTHLIPDELVEIPTEYFSESEEQGQLIELNYETYESFSYEERTEPLNKRAIVYLPFNYDENTKYNVMYIMHGGWSNETTTLGTPNNPSSFKNVIDNAIENGDMKPLIIVCPTYNNTNENGQDSDNYSLALQLTRNYHNELVNDLMPAVEGRFSTYAENTSLDGLRASRDHRGFMGFSMGSVTTWRTFEYCLDYFRYFFPSSGAITSDSSYMDNIVENSGYSDDDFFIWGMSGTSDFAYSSFSNQMNAMMNGEHFHESNDENSGNIAFNVKEGYSHNGVAQQEYFYNGLLWCFNQNETNYYDLDTPIEEVINDPIFEDYGDLIFPVNDNYYGGNTLRNLSLTWYHNIDPNKTVEICNYLKREVLSGRQIFYNIYSDEERAANPELENTGLFFFKGEENAPFAITCAGGGFAYVAAMHDSFPHALEISKQGFNAFAIIYRPGWETAYQDLARAISFIFRNAEELGVSTDYYSLWGGSAGGRMAATLASYGVASYGGDNVSKPSTAIIQYTGHSDYNPNEEVATFACVGNQDGIANWRTMQNRINNLNNMGVDTEFHVYEGLSHGFGLGTGTVAEGWINLAINFWKNHMR